MRKICIGLAAAMAIVSGLPAVAENRPYAEGKAPQADARAFPALTPIYRITGIRDNGGAPQAGIATVFHCSNPTGVTQQVRFVVRGFTNSLVANATFSILLGGTFSVGTHDTLLFFEDGLLATGIVGQGRGTIDATSPLVHCTAMIVDAATAIPNGIELNMVRLNPAPGTME
jgi:hypothetical protein